jgi:hypothetical protein
VLKSLLSIRRDVAFLSLLSAGLLFVKLTWLNAIPELFVGGHVLGLIAEAVLASFVASFIFYFVVVHLKEHQDKERIAPHVKRWASRIVFNCTLQLNSIAHESGHDLKFPNPDKTKLTSALEKINPELEPPARLLTPKSSENWLEMMASCSEDTEMVAQNILRQALYINSNLVSIIIDITETMHHRTIKVDAKIPFGSSTLRGRADYFYAYWVKCWELERHIDQM